MTRKSVLLMLLSLTFLLLVGCSNDSKQEETSSESSDDFVSSEDLEAPPGVELLELPEDVVPEEEIRIAAIMVQNNPFGAEVKIGTDFAKEVLSDRNTKVDWISVSELDPKEFEEAVENTITAQYDALTIFGLSDALIPSLKRATDAGIDVYTFNTDIEDSTRIAYWGQDGFDGGKKIGQEFVEQMDEKGKYAIITGSFNVVGHEDRRKGAREIIDEHPDMELVGEYENNDKAEEAYDIVQNLLTSNPDIEGIYVTAGGPFGASKALKDAGKDAGEIKLVAHDWIGETVEYIREGYLTGVLDQNPFNQGYAPVIAAFNKLANDIEPDEKNWFEGDIATPDNVDEKIPE